MATPNSHRGLTSSSVLVMIAVLILPEIAAQEISPNDTAAGDIYFISLESRDTTKIAMRLHLKKIKSKAYIQRYHQNNYLRTGSVMYKVYHDKKL